MEKNLKNPPHNWVVELFKTPRENARALIYFSASVFCFAGIIVLDIIR